MMSAAADDAADSFDGEIARIIELFRVRDLVRLGVEDALATPRFLAYSEARRACIRQVGTDDRAIATHSRVFREVFSDPTQRELAIRFLSSDAGRKVVDWAMVPDSSLADLKSNLTAEEQSDIIAFIQNGGDRSFLALRRVSSDTSAITRAVEQECL